jgi:hypothetical protein
MKLAIEDTQYWVTGGDPPSSRSPGYYRSATADRGMFFRPDVSVNPMLAWNGQAQLRSAFHFRACLSPTSRGPRFAAGLVRSTFPFSQPGTSVVGMPAIRYIEAEVASFGPGASLAIGVVHDKNAMRGMRLDAPLGHYSGRWKGSSDVRPLTPCTLAALLRQNIHQLAFA